MMPLRRSTARLLALTVLAAVYVACAGARAPLGNDRRALEGAGCVRVAAVDGVGVGGWGTTRDQQLYWASTEAWKRAEALGATHVAFVDESGDQNQLVLHGIAYQCP